MKKNQKILIIILAIAIPIILIACFFVFNIFFYDPFIKFAPKNTFFYSYINLNNKNLIKERIDIKNIIENNISKENLNIINKYYKNKFSIFISKDENKDNIYIVFNLKNNKNIELLNNNDFENIINKYLNINIKLNSGFIGDNLFITNNIDSLEKIKENEYDFYKDYLYLIYKNKEYKSLVLKSGISGYFNVESNKEILEKNNINIFNKDYSLFSLNYINKKIIFNINNIKNIKSDINLLNINNLNKPNIIVDNFNINNLYNKLIPIFKKDKDINNKILFAEKILEDENININDFQRLFNNKSKIFLTFNNEIRINNIKNYLIILDLKNFTNYFNEIKSFEKIFLREKAKSNTKTLQTKISTGLLLKEEIINYNDIKFENIVLENNGLKQSVDFYEFKDKSRIYFSRVNNKGYYIISNSPEMLSNLYYSEEDSDIFEINKVEQNGFNVENVGNEIKLIF